jgi:hypothetical protein
MLVLPPPIKNSSQFPSSSGSRTASSVHLAHRKSSIVARYLCIYHRIARRLVPVLDGKFWAAVVHAGIAAVIDQKGGLG